jgi:hypothetical protein
MKAWGFLLILLAFIYACQSNQDDEFHRFFNDFQKQVDNRPLMRAFLEGQLAFDSTIIAFQPAEVDSLSAQINNQFETLNRFSQERLSPDLYLYHQRTEDFLALLIKRLLIDQIHRTNPDFYDPRPRLIFLLQSKASQSEWSTAFLAISTNYESASQLLLSVNPEQSAAAIQQGIEVFQILSSDELKKKIEKLGENTSDKEENIRMQIERTKLATKSYIGRANSLWFESRNTTSISD